MEVGEHWNSLCHGGCGVSMAGDIPNPGHLALGDSKECIQSLLSDTSTGHGVSTDFLFQKPTITEFESILANFPAPLSTRTLQSYFDSHVKLC